MTLFSFGWMVPLSSLTSPCNQWFAPSVSYQGRSSLVVCVLSLINAGKSQSFDRSGSVTTVMEACLLCESELTPPSARGIRSACSIHRITVLLSFSETRQRCTVTYSYYRICLLFWSGRWYVRWHAAVSSAGFSLKGVSGVIYISNET